jgi:hypothetical protein
MPGLAGGFFAFGAFSEFFQIDEFAHQDDVLVVGDENKTVMGSMFSLRSLGVSPGLGVSAQLGVDP